MIPPADGVQLAAFDRSHAERTRAWMNDPELARLLGRERPVSDLEHERWLDAVLRRDDCVFFAILAGDPPCHVGNVWLWDIDARHRKAELRIVLGDPTRVGRGVGSTAIRLACAYAFDVLNLHKIFAYVLDFNPRARRAFEKAGFSVEGVLQKDRWAGDRYADVFVLGKLAA
jgi:RimJ/RimL family protein N-acetyltransferase